MKEQHDQDDELRNALRKIHDRIEIPASTDSWQRVQKRLGKIKRRRLWQRRIKIGAAIAVVSFILNLTLNQSLPTAYSQIGTLLKKWKEDVVEFFHEQQEQNEANALTVSPPDHDNTDGGTGPMQIVTLEEAQAKVSFLLMIPSEIPKELHLDAVRIFGSKDTEQYNEAQLEYVNMNGEVLNIIQRKIEGQSADLKATMSAGAGEYKDIYIHGNAGILMIPIEGNLNMEWLTEDRILVRISGKLSEADLLTLASSLK
ncbi:hypothetical protein EBB07_18435 [Paenibacillaceae bacterium]|nr:hypothetical protein EBB07_18435 [Paenibacillaceae bacterium]